MTQVGRERVSWWDGRPTVRRLWAAWLLATLGCVALTAALVPLGRSGVPGVEAMYYLCVAVACALLGGRLPAIVASIFGALLLNYFFTDPLHSFAIAHGESVVILVAYVAVSLAVSGVVDTAARRAQQASVALAEAQTLDGLNLAILEARYTEGELLELVRDTFGATGVRLQDGAPDGADALGVRSTQGRWLVLEGAQPSAGEQRILAAFATHLGVLREREELVNQTRAAHELEAGNRTRTALLAAVSHDLRTPLAGVKAAASTLRVAGDRITDAERHELVQAVETGTDRLTSIVADLLDMTRLNAGAVEVATDEVDLGVAVAGALSGMRHREWVEVPANLPRVRADAGLLERVLANVLANAVRYSFRVELVAEIAGDRVRVSVVDHGPGMPASAQERMFEPFQRLWDATQGGGIGLGLAVARGLAEAQGGTLTAQDTPGGGLTLVLDLPGVGS